MRLKIAIQKSGRLADESMALLERCGLRFRKSKDKLFCYGINLPVDLLLMRDDDIPRLLLDQVCDLGIVGENVAQEIQLDRGVDELVKLRTLDFGYCRLSIAVPEDESYRQLSDLSGKRIATSYPAITRRFLEQQGIEARISELSGSVEIAPSLGTADCIAELVSTGTTLRANHLKEVAQMLESQAALYQSSAELSAEKQALLDRLLPRVDGVQQVKESKYVMLHAPKAALEEIKSHLPGAESPTVLPLDGSDERVAVHAVCRETVFWEHLEALKSAGASAVLVLPVEKMLA